MEKVMEKIKFNLIHILKWICVLSVIMLFDLTFFSISILITLLLLHIGIVIGGHRYITHQSFVARNLFVHSILIFLAEYGSPGDLFTTWGWHKNHHKHSDTKYDVTSPHNQLTFPLIRSMIGKINNNFTKNDWEQFNKLVVESKYELIDEWNTTNMPASYIRVINFISSHGINIHLTIFAILLYINPLYVIYFWGLPVTLTLLISRAMHTSGHAGIGSKFKHYAKLIKSYRTYDTKIRGVSDHSVNTPLLYILYGGDVYHNNHHAYPNSYIQGFNKGEHDINAWIIKNILATKTSLKGIS